MVSLLFFKYPQYTAYPGAMMVIYPYQSGEGVTCAVNTPMPFVVQDCVPCDMFLITTCALATGLSSGSSTVPVTVTARTTDSVHASSNSVIQLRDIMDPPSI
jgi:hypothetical protein